MPPATNFADAFCYLVILAGMVAFAAVLVRMWNLQPQPLRSWQEDQYAEDWSEVHTTNRHIKTTFATVRVGSQFKINADPGDWTFERIPLTVEGNNARCDVYDTFVHDDESITVVSIPIRS